MPNEEQFRQYVERLAGDFSFFLHELWISVGLPPPAEHQNQIAKYLQSGPRRRGVRAFRGASKTWVTLAYSLWRLFRDPNERVMIVSKSEKHSKDSLHMARKWIGSVPWLSHLEPDKGKNQRDSAVQFDVGPSSSDRTPSFSAYGVGGQITGARSSVIISDDVETAQNTLTLELRSRLREEIKELDSVIIPGGDIIILGTPHHEESLYDKLASSGYAFQSWPARFPTQKERVPDLSPEIIDAIDADESLVGRGIWAERFDEEELIEREASLGRSTFAMQYMMITELGDELKYPLKLSDLMVFPVQRDKAPMTIAWGMTNDRGGTTRCQDIPSLGFGTDGCYAPIMYDNEWGKYTGTKAWIDPSGRGKDRTAICIVSHLNGTLYIHETIGVSAGYSHETLVLLATLCRTYGVREVYIEDNFGQGMFAELFRPVLRSFFQDPCDAYPDGWGASIDSVRVSGQKEIRIINSLEPGFNSHRIVVSPKVAENQDLQRQITRITRQRGCLQHDDEIDAMASCVAQWREVLSIDPGDAVEARKDRWIEDQLDAHYKATGRTKPGPRWFDHSGRPPSQAAGEALSGVEDFRR